MRTGLPLTLCIALWAPACMAQSLPGDDATPANAAGEQASDREPTRSAMGRVMGIMIEALRQEAMGEAPVRPEATRSGSTPGDHVALDIEVGDAFRLPPPAGAQAPRDCGVQPCDRDGVPNLRIASQK